MIWVPDFQLTVALGSRDASAVEDALRMLTDEAREQAVAAATGSARRT